MMKLLLASGGLDSALLAALNPAALHLSINYGQRHAEREIAAARRIAEHYGCEHHTVDLPALSGLLPSSLTGGPGTLNGPPTVVPNRNAILLSIGVGVALTRGLDTVLIGVNAADYDTYPDCRADFIEAFHWTAMAATEGHVGVQAPLLQYDKPWIGQKARHIGVPIDLTWSCYAGGAIHCGTCGACKERGRALVHYP